MPFPCMTKRLEVYNYRITIDEYFHYMLSEV